MKLQSILNFLPRASTLILVLFFGLLIGRCFTPIAEGTATGETSGGKHAAADHGAASATQAWTCSMHPTVMAPTEGDCPLCGMDLIPVESDGGASANPNALRLEEGQKALAGIQTTRVRREQATHRVRLVGKLAVDETAIATLSAYVGGRLDRLYVDYTGLKVRAGDHLAEIYSPQLFHAQEELIVAVAAAERSAAGGQASLARISKATVEAARKKLSLYGLTEEQMEEIITLGKPSDQITLNAPMGGTVIHRNAVEGQYVKEGDPLYTIADLRHLWLELDVYESDLPWIGYGQAVSFEVDAWPGESFSGTISFLDPVLDPITRTVHVRVEVDNQDGRLRPAMYARASVETEVEGPGRAAPIDLAGMWMCPMHPEVLAETEGDCRICGMPLETTESLGFGGDGHDHEHPLLIPITAPLLTGDRAVVYVALPDREQHGASIFEARDVTLGPRAGDDFVVVSGLEEGEMVVTRGAFTIDSELQLRGKPSMMAPDGGAAGGHQHGGRAPGSDAADDGVDAPSMDSMEESITMEMASEGFRMSMGTLLKQLAELGEGLASDDLTTAATALSAFAGTLADIQGAEVPASAMDSLHALQETTAKLSGLEEIEAFRVVYEDLQEPMVTLASRYGYLGLNRPVAVFHCPMALEGGADWIDFAGDGTRNPYYGASMLKCGSEMRTLPTHEGH